MQRHGALQYLNNVRARPEWKDVVTEASVELGDPAETILDVCEKRGIDSYCDGHSRAYRCQAMGIRQRCREGPSRRG
jgi:nucleotide-binding universal stress UspA family protein